MATHCLSGRGLLGCGWQEGFSRGDGGSLTEMGHDLLPIFYEMTKWGFRYIK